MPSARTDSDATTHALRLIRAVSSLSRAASYLYYEADQWPRGEQLAARDEAIALLLARRRELLDSLRA